ncbi:glycosyl hydrolase family 8 [Sphingobium sp. CFD-2]|uniref:glycosyl hydrolase family 8 n=1 Tax=Sphingobium sp. CFD-2 TaxID=2878542 RepID=UPI0027D462A0|nr:glycosyl hydrolase family 8 [Sphingobium sp. CFD-2]
MGVDRRSFSLAAFAMLAGACGRANGTRAVRTDALWSTFKSAFLLRSGRIVDNGNGGVSHSEGQGYGLWLALCANDRCQRRSKSRPLGGAKSGRVIRVLASAARA